jgi:RNA polymerase sigma-70 factor (ECF subfamily)
MDMTDSQPRPGQRDGEPDGHQDGQGVGRPGEPGSDLGALLIRVARGDEAAFDAVYGAVAGHVFGITRSVLRDPAQAEEVSQEVLLEIWRTASRFDARRGSPMAWVVTLAHRRAVDRVRSQQASTAREQRAAKPDISYDIVADTVAARRDAERVRRCLGSLTELQHESITLAYYRGCTYREVAGLLNVPVGTIKTRMRDGLIRLRDCLGVD